MKPHVHTVLMSTLALDPQDPSRGTVTLHCLHCRERLPLEIDLLGVAHTEAMQQISERADWREQQPGDWPAPDAKEE